MVRLYHFAGVSVIALCLFGSTALAQDAIQPKSGPKQPAAVKVGKQAPQAPRHQVPRPRHQPAAKPHQAPRSHYQPSAHKRPHHPMAHHVPPHHARMKPMLLSHHPAHHLLNHYKRLIALELHKPHPNLFKVRQLRRAMHVQHLHLARASQYHYWR